jgi:hypothetical protein
LIILGKYEAPDKIDVFWRTVRKAKRKEKMEPQGCPKRVSEGSRGARGTALDGQRVAQNHICIVETDDFQEGDQNDVSETKEHDKKEWALVVDKRALQKRPKIIIFDDPPWPKSGFYKGNMMV